MMPRRLATLALLWLVALPAFAAVGAVDSLDGDVRVVSAVADRPAQPGLELNEGDTVKTGENAWALLTMTDGASLTLRQNSQLRIDSYRYDPTGDAAQNSSLLSLIKGAFRSITGYIGRTNRAGYQIATPTAMIGIRGTDHEPAYYPPGAYSDREAGTYDKVNAGESFIRNPQGEVSVRPGQSGFVHHDARAAPRVLAHPPAFYQRHAEFDKRAAERRQEFHRGFEEQHRRLLQDRAQLQPSHEREKPGHPQQHGQRSEQQRRELFEQRRQERQSLREQRREQRAEEQKKEHEREGHWRRH